MPSEQKATRKLRAILSADVKGYSLLMAKDEISTLQTLKDSRNIMSERIKEHSGRVVDTVGDNLLAEFSSTVDAVQAAVDIQRKIAERNTALSEDRKMEFRIGINLGDVIHEQGRIYGNGVNVAARVESIADPGGVCISGAVFDQIENKISLGYEYLGEQNVKNISKPVRIYRVLLAPEAIGTIIGEKKHSHRKWHLKLLAVLIAILLAGWALKFWQAYLKTSSTKVEPASIENAKEIKPR